MLPVSEVTPGYTDVSGDQELDNPGHHSLPEILPQGGSSRSNGYRLNAHALLTFALAVTSVLLLSLLIRRSGNGSLAQVASMSEYNVTRHDEKPDVTTDTPSWAPLPNPEEVIETIVFGSCMKEDMPQPFWDTVVHVDPQVTVLAGDNVYMKGVKRCSDVSCNELKHAYEALDAHPSFQGAKAKLPMVAILDDHDYGYNDCHEGNPFKDIAKDMFFDFFDIPPSDERRTRQNEGLYTSYEWGPEGKRLQLILLDTRYSRSAFLYDDDLWGYVAYNTTQNTDKRILSDQQWAWLEDVLQRPANVRLVVSGIQVLSEGTWGFEHWALIPNELDRLKLLLKKYCTDADGANRSLPVLLSGDRHIGAFYHDKNFDLYEVTASSWTHTIPDGWDPDGVKCEGDECIEEDPTRVGAWVGVNHFGVAHADWSERTLDISLVRAETSYGYPVKSKWKENTDAGEVLKKLSLDIP